MAQDLVARDLTDPVELGSGLTLMAAPAPGTQQRILRHLLGVLLGLEQAPSLA